MDLSSRPVSAMATSSAQGQLQMGVGSARARTVARMHGFLVALSQATDMSAWRRFACEHTGTATEGSSCVGADRQERRRHGGDGAWRWLVVGDCPSERETSSARLGIGDCPVGAENELSTPRYRRLPRRSGKRAQHAPVSATAPSERKTELSTPRGVFRIELVPERVQQIRRGSLCAARRADRGAKLRPVDVFGSSYVRSCTYPPRTLSAITRASWRSKRCGALAVAWDRRRPGRRS
jgi:hypothetical protein